MVRQGVECNSCDLPDHVLLFCSTFIVYTAYLRLWLKEAKFQSNVYSLFCHSNNLDQSNFSYLLMLPFSLWDQTVAVMDFKVAWMPIHQGI